MSPLLKTHRGSAAEKLRKVLIFLTEPATDHADIARLVVREVMAHPVGQADATAQSRELLYRMSAEVQRGQNKGEFLPNFELRLAAAIIVSAYFAIAIKWVRCEGEFHLAEALQRSWHTEREKIGEPHVPNSRCYHWWKYGWSVHGACTE